MTFKCFVNFSKWLTAKGDAILRNRVSCDADKSHAGEEARGPVSPGGGRGGVHSDESAIFNIHVKRRF